MGAKSSAPSGTVAVVTALAQPVAAELGLLLWDVRFIKEGASWILRIFIDREETSVGIDDCVEMSHRMSALLDEKDPIPQSYCLEVSSPGLERELTQPAHFAYCAGWPVRVKLYRPVDGVRLFEGHLMGLSENGGIMIRTDEGNTLTWEKKDVSVVHAVDPYDDEELEL